MEVTSTVSTNKELQSLIVEWCKSVYNEQDLSIKKIKKVFSAIKKSRKSIPNKKLAKVYGITKYQIENHITKYFIESIRYEIKYNLHTKSEYKSFNLDEVILKRLKDITGSIQDSMQHLVDIQSRTNTFINPIINNYTRKKAMKVFLREWPKIVYKIKCDLKVKEGDNYSDITKISTRFLSEVVSYNSINWGNIASTRQVKFVNISGVYPNYKEMCSVIICCDYGNWKIGETYLKKQVGSKLSKVTPCYLACTIISFYLNRDITKIYARVRQHFPQCSSRKEMNCFLDSSEANINRRRMVKDSNFKKKVSNYKKVQNKGVQIIFKDLPDTKLITFACEINSSTLSNLDKKNFINAVFPILQDKNRCKSALISAIDKGYLGDLKDRSFKDSYISSLKKTMTDNLFSYSCKIDYTDYIESVIDQKVKYIKMMEKNTRLETIDNFGEEAFVILTNATAPKS